MSSKNFGVILALAFLMLFSFVSAQGCESSGYIGRFDPNTNVTITETCPTCTFINLTVKDSNSNAIVLNQEMVLSNGLYNYTVDEGNHSIDGTYIVEGFSNLDNPFKACYDILSGRSVETGEAVIYVILMILALFVFLFCLYGAIILPFSNEKNDLERIINVNWSKYFKIVFMVLTYLMFLWIMNLSISLTSNLTSLTQYAGFFEMIFNVLSAIFYPLFVIVIIIFNILMIKDWKINKLISRGLTPR